MHTEPLKSSMTRVVLEAPLSLIYVGSARSLSDFLESSQECVQFGVVDVTVASYLAPANFFSFFCSEKGWNEE